MKGSSVIAAFLGGAVVGAAVALLLAPERGEDTRRMIREFVEDEVDGIEDYAMGVKKKIQSKINGNQ